MFFHELGLSAASFCGSEQLEGYNIKLSFRGRRLLNGTVGRVLEIREDLPGVIQRLARG